MVGRFVEEQDVGRAHQRAPSCRRIRQPPEKLFTGLCSSDTLKAEAEDQRLGAGFGIVLAGVVQRHVGLRHAHAVVAGLGGRHLVLGGEQHGVAVDDEIGRRSARFPACPAPPGPCATGRDRIVAAVFVQRCR